MVYGWRWIGAYKSWQWSGICPLRSAHVLSKYFIQPRVRDLFPLINRFLILNNKRFLLRWEAHMLSRQLQTNLHGLEANWGPATVRECMFVSVLEGMRMWMTMCSRGYDRYYTMRGYVCQYGTLVVNKLESYYNLTISVSYRITPLLPAKHTGHISSWRQSPGRRAYWSNVQRLHATLSVCYRLIDWLIDFNNSDCRPCYSMAYSNTSSKCQTYIGDDRMVGWAGALVVDAEFRLFVYTWLSYEWFSILIDYDMKVKLYVLFLLQLRSCQNMVRPGQAS